MVLEEINIRSSTWKKTFERVLLIKFLSMASESESYIKWVFQAVILHNPSVKAFLLLCRKNYFNISPLNTFRRARISKNKKGVNKREPSAPKAPPVSQSGPLTSCCRIPL